MARTILLTIQFFLLNLYVYSQKPTQTIRGIVFDSKTKENLQGATIVLNSTIGSTTDLHGKFILNNVEIGRYNLEVKFLGYEPLVVPELLVNSGKEVVLEIGLDPTSSKLDEVVIKANIRKDKPLNSMASVSARTFSVEEASRFAGAIDDPARMVGSFAGVNAVKIHTNAIVVRGNAPKNLLWRLEGVDIPVPSHFSGSNVVGGGGLSMFSNQLLANSDFYTGAFPSEFGNSLAGVFDMKLRNGNNQKFQHSFQIGLQGIEFASEGPFKKSGESSYLANYRYSTMALIFPLLPEVKNTNEIPRYQDLAFKLNFPSYKYGTFTAWGIGGLGNTSMSGTNNPADWIYPEDRVKMAFSYNMGALGLSHSKRVFGKNFLKTNIAINAVQQFYSEKSRLDYNNPALLTSIYRSQFTSGTASATTSLTGNIMGKIPFKSGVSCDLYFFDIKNDAINFNTLDLNRINEGNNESSLFRGFLSLKIAVNPKISLKTGFNVSWFQLNNELVFEPRASLSWLINSNHTFSLGYGNHSQIEPLFVYFTVKKDSVSGESTYPNKNLNRSRAHHFVIAYDWSITENLRLKVEPYFQYLYRIPVVDSSTYSMVNFLSDWSFNQTLVNKGAGKNVGLDITIERFFKDNYYLISTFSLYKSTYKGGDNVVRRTRYDGGYIFNVLLGKEWYVNKKNLLGINVKFSLIGPSWYFPVDIKKSNEMGDIIYDELNTFSYRHSNIETISDFSISYRINKTKSSSFINIQVKNVIGKQYLGKKYNLKNKSIEDDFFTSPVPFISYRIEF